MAEDDNATRRSVLKTSAAMLAVGGIGGVAAGQEQEDGPTVGTNAYSGGLIDEERDQKRIQCSNDNSVSEKAYFTGRLSQALGLSEFDADGPYGDDWYYLEAGMTGAFASYRESMDFPYYGDSPELSQQEFCNGTYDPDQLPNDVDIDRKGLGGDLSIVLDLENTEGSLVIPDGTLGIGASPAAAVDAPPSNVDEASIQTVLSAAGLVNPFFGGAMAINSIADAYGVTDDDPSASDSRATFSWNFGWSGIEPEVKSSNAGVQFAIRVPPGTTPEVSLRVERESLNMVDSLERTYKVNSYNVYRA